MNKLLLAVLCVLAAPAWAQEFTISGRIEGFQQGDTLSFLRITYPGFSTERAFFVTTDAQGCFRYQGTQAHANDYIVTYQPVGGKAPQLDRMGVSLFVASGDHLQLQGERQLWGFCSITGGVYDHPIYGQIRARQDALGAARSTLLQQANQARERKDTEASTQLIDQFNRARTGSAAIDSLWLLYFADPTARENAAIEVLARVTSTLLDELESRYALLSEQVKNTHHGRLLADELTALRRLSPGNPAPDFALTNDQGTVRLADFRGKYLLIYHWGVCPGSISIDPQVHQLFGAVDPRQATIVSVSKDRAAIEQLNASVSPTDSLFGANIKANTDGMLAHPFADYDLNRGENGKIATVFAFGGLPYFVLLDPEGKIVGRGFHELFFEAQKILPRKQAVKRDQ